LELNALDLTRNNEDTKDQSSMQKIYHELLKLEERREHTIMAMNKREELVKKYFDKRTTSNNFHKDQLVLLWNKEKEKTSFHTKFETLFLFFFIFFLLF
jgi:hypothetical protein